MNVHKNAVLTPRGREQLIERLQSGESKASAAAAVGVSRQTARKWEKRMIEEGSTGLEDRSSRPHHSPTKVRRVQERQIRRLRGKRWTQAAIADSLGMAISTVGAVCRRLGLGRLPELERRPPIVRYERERAGELIHLDIKKLARIEPWGTESTAIAAGPPTGPAGSSCTYASTTRAEWPTPRSCPTRRASPARTSYGVPSPGSRSEASASRG